MICKLSYSPISQLVMVVLSKQAKSQMQQLMTECASVFVSPIFWTVRNYSTVACRPVAPSWTLRKEKRRPWLLSERVRQQFTLVFVMTLIQCKAFIYYTWSKVYLLMLGFGVFLLLQTQDQCLINNANAKLLNQNNVVLTPVEWHWDRVTAKCTYCVCCAGSPWHC